MQIDTAQMKKLTGGGDWLEARDLYQGEQSFIPSFMCFACTNSAPVFDNPDPASMLRTLFINYAYTFVENPDPANPSEKQAHDDLKNEIKQPCFIRGLQNLVFDAYADVMQNGLGIPSIVREHAQDQVFEPLEEAMNFIKEELNVTGDEGDFVYTDVMQNVTDTFDQRLMNMKKLPLTQMQWNCVITNCGITRRSSSGKEKVPDNRDGRPSRSRVYFKVTTRPMFRDS